MDALLALPVTTLLGLGLTAVSLAVVLAAEYAGRDASRGDRPTPRRLNACFKPIASAGFLLAAFGHPLAFASPAALALLAALVLGALGDVLLIPGRSGPLGAAFKLGVLSFLASHLAYVIAFTLTGLSLPALGLAALPLGLLGLVLWRYLARHVPATLRGAVGAYVLVISLMVAASVGAAAHGPVLSPDGPAWLAPLAAGVFYASDLTVARQRFVVARMWHRFLGLPLYYAAQFLFIGLLG
jgi:uncharacterized membrane protein YhhN